MMPPKLMLVSLGVLIVGTFLSDKASGMPLDKDDSAFGMSDFNSDYSSIDIEGFPGESKANDDEEVEYDEEIEGNHEEKIEESEEKHDNEINESEENRDNETKDTEEEVDKDEEVEIQETDEVDETDREEEDEKGETDKDEEDEKEETDKDESEETSDEDDEEEVKEDNQDNDDDKTIDKVEGKIHFNNGEENDYVHIDQILDEDDTQKETKSVSWYDKIKKYLETKLGLQKTENF